MSENEPVRTATAEEEAAAFQKSWLAALAREKEQKAEIARLRAVLQKAYDELAAYSCDQELVDEVEKVLK